MILNVIAMYRDAFRKHGRSPSSVLIPKGRQGLRFKALTKHFCGSPSVLDYGCGLGDLYPYLLSERPGVKYLGADIVPEFIESNRATHNASFKLVKSSSDIRESFDHVVASGVFNIRYGRNHWAVVQRDLKHLFSLCRISLSVDFMDADADYQQPHAYHQDIGELARFAAKDLSKRIEIDHSYMPYEFALIVFKDAGIRRPENIYAPQDALV